MDIRIKGSDPHCIQRISDVYAMRQWNAIRMNWDERIRFEWSYKLYEKFVSVVDFVHVHIKPCVYVPNWGKKAGKKASKDWDACAAGERECTYEGQITFSNIYNDDEANSNNVTYKNKSHPRILPCTSKTYHWAASLYAFLLWLSFSLRIAVAPYLSTLYSCEN